MSDPLEGLKPESVWRYFSELCRIPRGSKNEAAAARYVLDVAQRLGLPAKQDEAGNVIVKKPASPGRESVRGVCLQGHLDMVCEKNAEKVHDFTKDPIEIVRKENVLMAAGTTLGADNGIGVATELAIMEDRGLEHGPLEFLFTVDEETGLTGAGSLQPDSLESRILLNLDSEEEGALYVGCAGGKDTSGSWRAECESPGATATAARVRVKGLRGGHSGLDIDKGRGNAIKCLCRVLLRFSELGIRVSAIGGGNKRNAIPREADALVFLPKGSLRKAEAIVKEVQDAAKGEVATVDPDLSVTMSILEEHEGKVLKRGLQKKILQTICALPHGVIKMSAEIPGLVETSTNVAMIRTTAEAVVLETSQRSSVASEILEIAETVATIFALGGAEVQSGTGYPGWKPNVGSEILGIARSTYVSLCGKEPHVKAVHAGLECGIIGERLPGMDMISFGPTLEAVHSPEEKIYVDTVDRFWSYLLAILKNVT